MPEFNVTFRVKCGDLTCASKSGDVCDHRTSRGMRNVPYCWLFDCELFCDANGWVARCAECLAATTEVKE